MFNKLWHAKYIHVHVQTNLCSGQYPCPLQHPLHELYHDAWGQHGPWDFRILYIFKVHTHTQQTGTFCTYTNWTISSSRHGRWAWFQTLPSIIVQTPRHVYVQCTCIQLTSWSHGPWSCCQKALGCPERGDHLPWPSLSFWSFSSSWVAWIAPSLQQCSTHWLFGPEQAQVRPKKKKEVTS